MPREKGPVIPRKGPIGLTSESAEKVDNPANIAAAQPCPHLSTFDFGFAPQGTFTRLPTSPITQALRRQRRKRGGLDTSTKEEEEEKEASIPSLSLSDLDQSIDPEHLASPAHSEEEHSVVVRQGAVSSGAPKLIVPLTSPIRSECGRQDVFISAAQVFRGEEESLRSDGFIRGNSASLTPPFLGLNKKSLAGTVQGPEIPRPSAASLSPNVVSASTNTLNPDHPNLAGFSFCPPPHRKSSATSVKKEASRPSDIEDSATGVSASAATEFRRLADFRGPLTPVNASALIRSDTPGRSNSTPESTTPQTGHPPTTGPPRIRLKSDVSWLKSPENEDKPKTPVRAIKTKDFAVSKEGAIQPVEPGTHQRKARKSQSTPQTPLHHLRAKVPDESHSNPRIVPRTVGAVEVIISDETAPPQPATESSSPLPAITSTEETSETARAIVGDDPGDSVESNLARSDEPYSGMDMLRPESAAAITGHRREAIRLAKAQEKAVVEKCNRANIPVPEFSLEELIGKGSFGRVYKG